MKADTVSAGVKRIAIVILAGQVLSIFLVSILWIYILIIYRKNSIYYAFFWERVLVSSIFCLVPGVIQAALEVINHIKYKKHLMRDEKLRAFQKAQSEKRYGKGTYK